MSEKVASGLEVINKEKTTQTRLFIRMINKFFDCLNGRSFLEGELKMNAALKPYCSTKDERLEVQKGWHNNIYNVAIKINSSG